MALKIKASTFVTASYLQVDSGGVTFAESGLVGWNRRQFAFDQVACILLREDGLLSFQVGGEVFSLQTKLGKRGHQAVIDALLREVRRAGGREAE